MGLVTLVAFWGMNVKLWMATNALRLPLLFGAIWGASLVGLGMVGLGHFFIAVEALLVIILFFAERATRP